jgi:hypothetical protein
MAKPEEDKTQEPKAEQPKETPMAKPAVDPHAGLVKMHRDGKAIHAHPTVVREHEKNGWKAV